MAGIDGKVVAITGASSGIGEAPAVLLAQRGAKLVLGARRLDRLEALAGRIGQAARRPSAAPTSSGAPTLPPSSIWRRSASASSMSSSTMRASARSPRSTT